MGVFMRKKSTQLAATILLTYGFMKFISPFASPFIAAFLIVWAMNPFIEKVHRRTHFKKPFLAGLLLTIWTILLILVIWIISALVIDGSSVLFKEFPKYITDWEVILGNCCNGLEKYLGIEGVKMEHFVTEQINLFTKSFQVNILPSMMGKSFNYIKGMVTFFSFLAVMMIGVLLLSKDYNEITGKIKESSRFEPAREIFYKVVIYIKTFVKAQLIILLIISSLCAITLSVIGMKCGILYGFLTGFMDMLPFIGTGIMLVPLGAFYFLTNEYLKGVVCICLYAACAFLRELLEPKLIGNKVGIWPIAILFAVFSGIYLFGISGIIKGPLSLVIIYETIKYLWYTEEKESQESTAEID